MRTKSCLVALALLVAAAAPSTQIPASRIGEQVVIVGDLQRPLGEEVTISGRKDMSRPGDNVFLVEMVNGRPASNGTYTEVRGIDSWPDKTAATLRGCEIGTVRFLHLGNTNFGPDDKRWKGPHQTIFLSFEPSEVVEPRDLKLDKNK